MFNYIITGSIKKADTFEDLAEQTGLPVEDFIATMERYNGYGELKRDEEFGKPAELLTPLATPPYYAIEIMPLVLNTVGGAVIDKDARVIRPDGTPISGLYAAGNNTAGFYDSYPSTGTGLQISSIFGQVAAEHIKASG
jgi:3-oxosteroid 1-dehydrogenase